MHTRSISIPSDDRHRSGLLLAFWARLASYDRERARALDSVRSELPIPMVRIVMSARGSVRLLARSMGPSHARSLRKPCRRVTKGSKQDLSLQMERSCRLTVSSTLQLGILLCRQIERNSTSSRLDGLIQHQPVLLAHDRAATTLPKMFA